MDPEQEIWVYHHRYTSDDKLFEGEDPAQVKRKDLNEWLANHPDWQATTKEITGRINEIYQCDILTPEQREEWKSKPNFKQNLASVKIPGWYNILKKNPTELTIISLDPKKAPQEKASATSA